MKFIENMESLSTRIISDKYISLANLLLGSGLIVFGIMILTVGIFTGIAWNSFFKQALDSGETLNMVSVNASKSVTATAHVSNVSRPLTLAVHIDTPKTILKVEIKDSAGIVLT
jgi:hypothetical protein